MKSAPSSALCPASSYRQVKDGCDAFKTVITFIDAVPGIIKASQGFE